MDEKLEALKIIDENDVDVGLLKKCFKYPDDSFLLKYEPDMCKGLYQYNNTYPKDGFYRKPLNMEQYNLLKKVLNWKETLL